MDFFTKNIPTGLVSNYFNMTALLFQLCRVFYNLYIEQLFQLIKNFAHYKNIKKVRKSNLFSIIMSAKCKQTLM